MSRGKLKASIDEIVARVERSGKDVKALLSDLLNLIEELRAELEKARRRNEFLEAELEGKKRGKGNRGGEPSEESSEEPSAEDADSKDSKGTENPGNQSRNHSSEKRRKGIKGDGHPKAGKSGKSGPGRRSKADLEVHETRHCTLDRAELPPDARYKGTSSITIRDIRILPWNIRFDREVYYSESEGRCYVAALPEGYDQGEFGPELKGTVVTLKYDAGTSEPGIVRFLNGHGVNISSGSVSNILLQVGKQFAGEKIEIVRAGYQSGSCTQSDSTSAKVKGKNWHTHVLCGAHHTAFFTREHKDRMTLIDVLLGRESGERIYRYSELSADYLRLLGVSKRQRRRLAEKAALDQDYDQKEMDALLAELFAKESQRASIGGPVAEAMALTYYHEQQEVPIPEVLLTDDAAEYQLLALDHALCWIHDGRHYEKLDPLAARHQSALEDFRGKYWDYYRELAKYRGDPGEQTARKLERKFNRLFGARTGYRALDERIAKTAAKKEQMLVVLRRPEVPLHNNESELGARQAARRRDISLHCRSLEGVESMDALATIVGTCRKLSVQAGDYISKALRGLLDEAERLPARILAAAQAAARGTETGNA